MTPRVERPTLSPGDRVEDKRQLPPRRGGRGEVLAVNTDGSIAQVRWDGTDHVGWRATEFLRRLENPGA